MSNSEMPIGLILAPCETIIEDRRTGMKSLIGLYDRITVGKLPHIHPSISIFVSLTGGIGEYPCEVVCVPEATTKPVFSVKGKVKFEHPRQVLDMVFQLRTARFTQEGLYWIKVIVDDIPLMMRPLHVALNNVEKNSGDTTADSAKGD